MEGPSYASAGNGKEKARRDFLSENPLEKRENRSLESVQSYAAGV